jgi:hypothetical protein
MSRYTSILDGTNILDKAVDINYNYFLFVRGDSSWVILREKLDNTEYRYASGSSASSTAWTNRASLTYKTADEFNY